MPLTAGRRLCLGLAVGLAGLAGVSAKDHWAVLIAGSKSFFNYRHQADVCHSYKVLTERGFDPDKIITMIYDDVANSTQNPFPGKLYNRPAKSMEDAVDVYAGCKKDYTGKSITPDTFVAVLSGNATAAGGKVLRSTSEDTVFVNFVDHGGVGIIGFPGTQILHAKRLISTLEGMHEKGMYEQLVFYLETCESGSMFQGLLPPQLPVYAVTAANAKESSWGTYCGQEARIGNKTIETCLGDLFEVNWMSDSELHASRETLGEQFARVKNTTSKSHVMHYGQVEAFSKELVGDFQGSRAVVGLRGADVVAERAAAVPPPPPGSAVSARDVKLRLLYQAYERTGSEEDSERLVAEVRDREAVRALGHAIAERALGGAEGARALLGAPLAAGGDFAWTPALAACHERAVEAFGASCGWTENRLVLSKALFQLCEHSSGDAGPVLGALAASCGAGDERKAEFW
eukprot:CAMPEP_0204567832 /NCGR_PEP_ID=MMETSP0661-20131031/36820_1 /ASSEMBLY_ACC=CAM_ASM_000606 /TAXON_ID=109239 /ORGANISM="Alexandrium margalefi, Strain AMGDE01CS-322" /LENGTH=458 /DNA_ID=CAMNT_0051575783 /DNA_START=66 /DNA_END=1439 /DNA_ORIENTATION=+